MSHWRGVKRASEFSESSTLRIQELVGDSSNCDGRVECLSLCGTPGRRDRRLWAAYSIGSPLPLRLAERCGCWNEFWAHRNDPRKAYGLHEADRRSNRHLASVAPAVRRFASRSRRGAKPGIWTV